MYASEDPSCSVGLAVGPIILEQATAVQGGYDLSGLELVASMPLRSGATRYFADYSVTVFRRAPIMPVQGIFASSLLGNDAHNSC